MHQEMNLPSVITWYPFDGLVIDYSIIFVLRMGEGKVEDMYEAYKTYVYFNFMLYLSRRLQLNKSRIGIKG